MARKRVAISEADIQNEVDAWAIAMTPVFVPDELHPLERTVAQYAADQTAAGRPISNTRASALLKRGLDEGRLTRRLVRLTPGRAISVYRPK